MIAPPGGARAAHVQALSAQRAAEARSSRLPAPPPRRSAGAHSDRDEAEADCRRRPSLGRRRCSCRSPLAGDNEYGVLSTNSGQPARNTPSTHDADSHSPAVQFAVLQSSSIEQCAALRARRAAAAAVEIGLIAVQRQIRASRWLTDHVGADCALAIGAHRARLSVDARGAPSPAAIEVGFIAVLLASSHRGRVRSGFHGARRACGA